MFLVANLTPADPLSFAAVVVVLGLTSLVASLGRIRRATRVDPASTLRVRVSRVTCNANLQVRAVQGPDLRVRPTHANASHSRSSARLRDPWLTLSP